MFTVIDVSCHQFVEQGLSLEEIQEYCRRHTGLMNGFIPENMDQVQERVCLYRIEMENYHPELLHWN